MFSFINWFGSIFEKTKKNKGLWFTLLTFFSLAGIFISLGFVNFLVSDVAEKTYHNQKIRYSLNLKSHLKSKSAFVLSNAISMAQDESLKALILSEDINKSIKLDTKMKSATARLNKYLNSKYLKFILEPTLKAEVKNGVRVFGDGVAFSASIPLVSNEDKTTNLLFRDSILSMVDTFNLQNKKFVFLLNQSAMSQINIDFKGNYEAINKTYFLKKEAYEKIYTDSLKNLDFEKLEESGHYRGLNFFYVGEKLYDSHGVDIGIIVLAENVSDDNSFVNLVKNLVNSVTMVALGLIVSMILFLF
jgi:hypothetical protein